MIHIIILSHFACVTIGCILFYELLRKVEFNGKERFLISGIGISNLLFILDTFNIYSRHWWSGYSFDKIIEIACVILLCFSVLLLIVYFIENGKQEIYLKKKANIIIGSVFLIFIILQIISSIFDVLKSIPWACIGYIFLCMVQFKYLSKEVPADVSKEKVKNLEVLTDRENEIVKYVCEGKTNKEIAEILFISQNTVRNHIYNIYKKAGVKNKIELINRLK